MGKDKKKTGKDFGLNVNQAKFCEIYATQEEFFGNGVASYMEAYKSKNGKKKIGYMTAAANSSRLLTNAKILGYLDYLIEEGGLNDQHVDKQLRLVITQNADFKSKVSAIREYNRLRQRIIEKQEHTHKFQDLTDEELEDEYKRATAELEAEMVGLAESPSGENTEESA